MKRKLWWELPMSRKNWAVVYGLCTGLSILIGIGFWAWNKWYWWRLNKKVKEELPEENNEFES